MKIYTVCTLPKFHPEHVYRLLKQIELNYDGPIEMFVYTDRPALFDQRVKVIPIEHQLCERQWYKIDFFGPNIIQTDDPVIVMDLDWTILKPIDHIIDTPVRPGEFISYERWWREPDDVLPICGGLYKFNPTSCHKIWQTFYENPTYWQNAYRTSEHPFSVQGEQNFVWEHASATMKVVSLPGYKFGRTMNVGWDNNILELYGKRYCNLYGADYYWDGEWNPRILMVHG